METNHKGRNIRLLVPHYVSGTRNVRIYARVQFPEKRVFVQVPELKMKIYHNAVRPAEMMVLDLKKDVFSNLQADKLTLEVVLVGK